MLAMLFDTAGLSGAYFVAVAVKGISAGTFCSRTQQWLDPKDIFEGLVKGAVFGFTVTLIACYKGYNARGGAKGVGQATTEAMVDVGAGHLHPRLLRGRPVPLNGDGEPKPPMISVKDLYKSFGEQPRADRHQPGRRGGQHLRHPRRLGHRARRC